MRPAPAHLAHLRRSVETLAPMPDASWERGAGLFTYHRCARDAYLLHAGQVSAHGYHVLKGVLRLFYTTEDGRQFNKSFALESDPCGSFRSALTGEPSRFGIQALEPCEYLQVRFAELTALFEVDVHWERLGRKIAEMLALLNEQREAEFLLDSAARRYGRFLEQYPGLEERIPQYHIASYLGITSVALSRIRRKMRALNPG